MGTSSKKDDMTKLYPDIDPYDHGLLLVSDDNYIYWEACGNPEGKPVVVLHGGPGSGCSPGMRRYFDPQIYRIILFDQRGCGRSHPHASELDVDLSVNTTGHLVADLEALRQHLSLERWMLFGVSWGATLALAYAELYPDRVTEIILVGVTTTRKSEIDWLYHGVSPLLPEQWERFRAGAPADQHAGDLVEAYYHRLHDPDPAVRLEAARSFHAWEAALVSVDPESRPDPRWSQPDFLIARARIVTHYFRHRAWLKEGVLLQRAASLAGIPGILINGQLDLSSPLVTAWELAHAWPGSELVVVQGAGHSLQDPGMTEAIIAAIERLGGNIFHTG
jgi:proline iminopeptidase